jgi:hypothetical protein
LSLEADLGGMATLFRLALATLVLLMAAAAVAPTASAEPVDCFVFYASGIVSGGMCVGSTQPGDCFVNSTFNTPGSSTPEQVGCN